LLLQTRHLQQIKAVALIAAGNHKECAGC